MKKSLRNAMVVSLGLLTAGVAMANDAVLGALIGGGAGALVGRSVGGRDGTIIGGAIGAAAGAAIGSDQHRVRYGQRVDYYAPAPVYVTEETYYPPQTYYAPPVRVAPAPVYYVEDRYDRGDHWRRWHHRDRDWGRHERRGWDDHGRW